MTDVDVADRNGDVSGTDDDSAASLTAVLAIMTVFSWLLPCVLLFVISKM